MPAERQYFVYILASKVRRLYVGVTNDLERRVWQHQTKAIEGFTSRYNIDRLVWYESTDDVTAAITRERGKSRPGGARRSSRSLRQRIRDGPTSRATGSDSAQRGH